MDDGAYMIVVTATLMLHYLYHAYSAYKTSFRN